MLLLFSYSFIIIIIIIIIPTFPNTQETKPEEAE
jgi:hypothetical protein